MDVFFYEVFDEEKNLFKTFLPGTIQAGYSYQTIQEASYQKPPAPFLSIRTQSQCPVAWYPYVKAVFSRSRGDDHLEDMRQSGITVGSLDEYCATSVAEQALLFALALVKKLKQQQTSFYTFSRDGLTGRDLGAQKALILGVGAIGSEIARLCSAWGMDVKGVDIHPVLSVIPFVSLDEGLEWADMIFVAVPLTAETRGLLNQQTLLKARRGIYIVNISRGEVTPLQDMQALLEEGHLGGLALDVYEDEPQLAEDMRLGRTSIQTKIARQWHDHPDVMCTPHNAFNSRESLEKKTKQTVQAIQAYLKTGTFPL